MAARKGIDPGAERLERMYVGDGLSLGDIATVLGCSRPSVLALLRKHGIPSRTKASARRLALKAGKITRPASGPDSPTGRRTLTYVEYDKAFFKTWSPEMAYVLGWIATDGHINSGFNLYPEAKTTSSTSQVVLSQVEKEPLEKCRALLKCTAPLFEKRQKPRSIWQFKIGSDELTKDLVALGITPAKSLTLEMPAVPLALASHFIRGAWEGDGTIGHYSGCWTARLCSGSRRFLEDIASTLESLGLPLQGIHDTRDQRYFSFGYSGRGVVALGRLLYGGIPSTMFLTRKRVKFAAAESWWRTAPSLAEWDSLIETLPEIEPRRTRSRQMHGSVGGEIE
ncbi:MAG: hypothetical protein Q8P50_14630 [Bacillota bacterium]|nr:hypothetical protein [Bacillota bacterium]